MGTATVCFRCILVLILVLMAGAQPRKRGGIMSHSQPPETNEGPIIGILSVPETGGSPSNPCETRVSASGASLSCFASFYASWIESAGARAVLIPFDANASVRSALLDSVNGVLFTGGSLENLSFTSPYMVAAAAVLDAVVAKNDRGLFFPAHGTCQGMQVLSLLAAQNASVMAYNAFDAENLSLALDISWDGHHASRLLSATSAPQGIVEILGSDNVTLNLHHDGVPVDRFFSNAELGAFYILASTNADRVGAQFVSTMEAWDYPITATQWHPERPQFEWSRLGINHQPRALAAMRYVADFFVADARRNNQSFGHTPEGEALLKRYSVLSYPLVNTPDGWWTGYRYIVTDL